MLLNYFKILHWVLDYFFNCVIRGRIKLKQHHIDNRDMHIDTFLDHQTDNTSTMQSICRT